jgi:hypothetical protein
MFAAGVVLQQVFNPLRFRGIRLRQTEQGRPAERWRFYAIPFLLPPGGKLGATHSAKTVLRKVFVLALFTSH